ncbi:MAG: hypothetical protein ABI689_02020 [Thermoanaerobaculia bacterium]
MKRFAWLFAFGFVACGSVLVAQPTGCTPVAPGVVDGTFEAGSPWSAWTVQTSTNYGSPICDTGGCGTGGGTAGPFAGTNWAWFGGATAVETATAGQSVTIPSGSNLFLHFRLWIGSVSSPFTDTLTVSVDGLPQITYTEPATAEVGHTERYVDVSAFANGAAHALLFTYVGPTAGVGNFSVDSVELLSCTTPVELLQFSVE